MTHKRSPNTHTLQTRTTLRPHLQCKAGKLVGSRATNKASGAYAPSKWEAMSVGSCYMSSPQRHLHNVPQVGMKE